MCEAPGILRRDNSAVVHPLSASSPAVLARVSTTDVEPIYIVRDLSGQSGDMGLEERSLVVVLHSKTGVVPIQLRRLLFSIDYMQRYRRAGIYMKGGKQKESAAKVVQLLQKSRRQRTILWLYELGLHMVIDKEINKLIFSCRISAWGMMLTVDHNELKVVLQTVINSSQGTNKTHSVTTVLSNFKQVADVMLEQLICLAPAQAVHLMQTAHRAWWASRITYSTARSTVKFQAKFDNNIDHCNIHGGALLFGEYGFAVDFECAAGLVEMYWRANTDWHCTMQSNSDKNCTRWGVSIQLINYTVSTVDATLKGSDNEKTFDSSIVVGHISTHNVTKQIQTWLNGPINSRYNS
ncbi:hypothetical protein BXZ70DRAFT_911589 [Cristinia sonorae]|uniref:Tet-like 2OG-Fe(II) oxygenase domain-containing protein n=1 Tax=Cristinia sonorae TaxID=1940300 RepID=A0A8K0UDZ5_9AGAR|nr:hypothetical protein BXZ70DRAFT_911589 [Cristinia sonorae]